jgi:hypothetical protein
MVNTGEIQATSFSGPTPPANATIYARLHTKLGGVWRYVDITFSVRAPGVTATGCSAEPGTVVYGQNWAKGSATYYMRGLRGEQLAEWKNPGEADQTRRDYVYAGSRLIAVISK